MIELIKSHKDNELICPYCLDDYATITDLSDWREQLEYEQITEASR